MVLWLLAVVVASTNLLCTLAVGAIAFRISMLSRERLRLAGAPALMAFTPGGGAQTWYEMLLGSTHLRVADGALSISVWIWRISLLATIAALVAAFYVPY